MLSIVVIALPARPLLGPDDEWSPTPGMFEVLLEREPGGPWSALRILTRNGREKGLKKVIARTVQERTGLELDVDETDYPFGMDSSFGIFDCVGEPTGYGSPSDLWTVILLRKGLPRRSGFHRCSRTDAHIEFDFHPLGSIKSPHEIDPDTGVMLDGFLHKCPIMIHETSREPSLSSHMRISRSGGGDDEEHWPGGLALSAEKYFEKIAGPSLKGPSREELDAARRERDAWVRKEVDVFGYSIWFLSVNQLEIFIIKHFFTLAEKSWHNNICFEDAVKALTAAIETNENAEQRFNLHRFGKVRESTESKVRQILHLLYKERKTQVREKDCEPHPLVEYVDTSE